MKSKNEKFDSSLSMIFDLSKEKINENLELISSGLLDSLAIVSLIAAIDSCFQVIIDPSDLSRCKTIGKIYDLIELHLKTNSNNL